MGAVPSTQPTTALTRLEDIWNFLSGEWGDSDIVLEYDEGYVLTTVSDALSEWDRTCLPAFTIPSRSDLHEIGYSDR